jgi:CheY-like chemotaxis protein
LLLAPQGIAATATSDLIRRLGGMCTHISTPEQLEDLQGQTSDGLSHVTDVIVDHRVAGAFHNMLQNWSEIPGRSIRHILLVSPEERASQPSDGFDAWLIRPLREKSLTDVLCGRLRGMEPRNAINDNHHPGFGFSSLLDETSRELDVLVAEDDPVNARILRAVMEKSGCAVRVVDDFKALGDALSDEARLPDLVISDLHMPVGNGLDILPNLCLKLSTRKIPLIVLSGDTTQETRSILLNAGIATVLAKPAEPKRLIEEVLRLFPQKRIGRV